MASTSQGTDTKSGELTVEGIPPEIINPPSERVGRAASRLQSKRPPQPRMMHFFIILPSLQVVTEGTRIVLTCAATGVPEPEHVWFNVSFELVDLTLGIHVHEGSLIQDTERVVYDNQRVYLDHEGSLVIEKATKWEQKKKFVCRAKNDWGDDVKSAFVEVRQATHILDHPPPNLPLQAGGTGNITFKYEVDPLNEEFTTIRCEKDGER